MLGSSILPGSDEEKLTNHLLKSMQVLQRNLDLYAGLMADFSARLEQKRDQGASRSRGPSRTGRNPAEGSDPGRNRRSGRA